METSENLDVYYNSAPALIALGLDLSLTYLESDSLDNILFRLGKPSKLINGES